MPAHSRGGSTTASKERESILWRSTTEPTTVYKGEMTKNTCRNTPTTIPFLSQLDIVLFHLACGMNWHAQAEFWCIHVTYSVYFFSDGERSCPLALAIMLILCLDVINHVHVSCACIRSTIYTKYAHCKRTHEGIVAPSYLYCSTTP